MQSESQGEKASREYLARLARNPAVTPDVDPHNGEPPAWWYLASMAVLILACLALWFGPKFYVWAVDRIIGEPEFATVLPFPPEFECRDRQRAKTDFLIHIIEGNKPRLLHCRGVKTKGAKA